MTENEENKTVVSTQILCPDCGSIIKHIAQYNRWYCDSCKIYLDKDFDPDVTYGEESEKLWKEHLRNEFQSGHLLPFIILNEALGPKWYYNNFLQASRDKNELCTQIEKYFIAQKEDVENEIERFQNVIVPHERIQTNKASFRKSFTSFTFGLLREKVEKQVEELQRTELCSGKIFECKNKIINPSLTYGMDDYKIKVQYVNIPYIPRLEINKREITVLILDQQWYLTPRIFEDWKSQVVIYCMDSSRMYSIPNWNINISGIIEKFEKDYFNSRTFEPDSICERISQNIETTKIYFMELKRIYEAKDLYNNYYSIIPDLKKLSDLIELLIGEKSEKHFNSYKNRIPDYRYISEWPNNFQDIQNRMTHYEKYVMTDEKKKILDEAIKVLKNYLVP